MRRLFGGAVLLIAGIVAFVEAHFHRPEYDCLGPVQGCERGETLRLIRGHLTETPYDVLSAGAWALTTIGVALIVAGLIASWRSSRI